ERFHRSARERGKQSLAVLLPTGLDLVLFNDTGTWVYTPLLERLDELDVEIADLGPPLIEALGDRDPCEIFRSCDGHFNPEGNEMLAELVAAQLAERGLLD
ncbi:MAG: hypothetical protein O7G30_03900, partial [Proteobacteria bacterium]|nr:hypothetical protein [Pseudomonadota bacterium]